MEQGIKEMLEAYAKALKDGSLLSGETARALAGRMETDMSVAMRYCLWRAVARTSNGRSAS